MKTVRSWSYTPWVINNQIYRKNFSNKENEKKISKKAIAMLSALHANTIKQINRVKGRKTGTSITSVHVYFH